MSLTTNRSLGPQETNHGVQLAIKVDCMWKWLGKQNKNTTSACKLKLNSHPDLGGKKNCNNENGNLVFT